MKIYRTSQFVFQEGQELTYNYPKAPYSGTCVVLKVNPDGTLDVKDHSGRLMPKMPTHWDRFPMFKEMIAATAKSKKQYKISQFLKEDSDLDKLIEMLRNALDPEKWKKILQKAKVHNKDWYDKAFIESPQFEKGIKKGIQMRIANGVYQFVQDNQPPYSTENIEKLKILDSLLKQFLNLSISEPDPDIDDMTLDDADEARDFLLGRWERGEITREQLEVAIREFTAKSKFRIVEANEIEKVIEVPEKISTYCSWCKKHMSGPDVGYDQPVSHGICEKCQREHFGDLMDEYDAKHKSASRTSNKLFKIAVSPESNERKITTIKGDIRGLRKDIKALEKEIKKITKDLKDLNVGNRKFWQHLSPVNSLQRKVERFEQVEREFAKLKKTLDANIRRQINKKVKPSARIKE